MPTRGLRRTISCVLAALVLLSVPSMATADLVSASTALELQERGRARTVVDQFLGRADVAEQLVALGVDPEVARLRAASLSTAELNELAGQLEELPAGGDGFLAILGITFIVLLVLELVGAIDIFKKI